MTKHVYCVCTRVYTCTRIECVNIFLNKRDTLNKHLQTNESMDIITTSNTVHITNVVGIYNM